MRIQWFGHSSFLLVSNDGTTIVTDPYEPEGYNGMIKYDPIGITPDIVTISHNHPDHCGVDQFENDFQTISTPGSKTIRDIKIAGFEWYHDAEMSVPNIIFLMNIDRIRVCHLGDIGSELTPQMMERIGDIDILLIPVGGRYTIGPAEATALIGRMRPKIAIPMHYLTPKIGFQLLPVDEFLQGKDNVIVLNSTEFEITKEQLPEQTSIVILQHAR
jgi:L-ascorbate metabolism protein UlaG (beta-lactamase superfamily)